MSIIPTTNELNEKTWFETQTFVRNYEPEQWTLDSLPAALDIGSMNEKERQKLEALGTWEGFVMGLKSDEHDGLVIDDMVDVGNKLNVGRNGRISVETIVRRAKKLMQQSFLPKLLFHNHPSSALVSSNKQAHKFDDSFPRSANNGHILRDSENDFVSVNDIVVFLDEEHRQKIAEETGIAPMHVLPMQGVMAGRINILLVRTRETKVIDDESDDLDFFLAVREHMGVVKQIESELLKGAGVLRRKYSYKQFQLAQQKLILEQINFLERIRKSQKFGVYLGDPAQSKLWKVGQNEKLLDSLPANYSHSLAAMHRV